LIQNEISSSISTDCRHMRHEDDTTAYNADKLRSS
jgi:hypothetical protein